MKKLSDLISHRFLLEIILFGILVSGIVVFTNPRFTREVFAQCYPNGNASCIGAAVQQGEQSSAISSEPIIYYGKDTDSFWFSCRTIGIGCSQDPTQQGMGRSAVGQIASAIGTMYVNPPADLAYWVRDTGQSLGFIPKSAYAQGTGFTGLAPLLPLWKVFRNAAYVLLALALIIIGFMIMFRRKIDPKTVVTVQNALPAL